MYNKYKKKKITWLLAAAVLLSVLAMILIAVLQRHTVKNVYVEGNLHYSQEEIKEFVMQGPLGNNSLYLSFKYRNKGIENVPFVDVMDVDILAPDTIKIIVYEKALAGYVRYMDSCMYFDKDGYVMECSDVKTEGVPQITGLSFDYMVLGGKLPVEDEAVFDNVMNLTKLLDKYELEADTIFFHSSGEITIYFGEIKAALGDDSSQLENKMMLLPQFLSKLEGKKGTLRMENLTQDRTDVSFQLEE
ncbi:MAG: cell division protein FtsQ [Lachnospiraceae bacterium]|nr:cell division protein FtsQ [Lachnospiraceae bacterium]